MTFTFTFRLQVLRWMLLPTHSADVPVFDSRRGLVLDRLAIVASTRGSGLQDPGWKDCAEGKSK
jgi:hypothetical protein